jgi:signal transduction histidine kinase
MRLRQQLMLSYIPLLLIPIIVIGIITRSAAEYGLTLLVTEQGHRQAELIANRFANYYNRQHSWDGVAALFDDLLPTRPTGPQQSPLNPRRGPPVIFQPSAEQIILAEPNGNIIASNVPQATGQALSPQTIEHGIPIMSNNQEVGVLVVGAALGVLDEAQRQLLDTVNTALIAAGLLSAGVTILIGLWLSGQITAPITALTHGVRVLASGQWSQHIQVYSSNELGELTQAFNQMADNLVQQQTLRKQLMADIAHDLRTPLSVMTLEIEGIKAGLQTPEAAATNLGDEVEWLSRLVSDVHTLSQIDAGQLTIQSEPTDLTIFLESVYRHWHIIADQQKRELLLSHTNNLPIVIIDPPRMRQVLGNLINNALQHTEATITLTAEANSHQTLICVKDSGQGIPSEALPRLFERFYRIDHSRRSTTGSGLGLSIAYQLTALQNGELTVESTVGQGTTFTIRLPITQAEQQKSRQGQQSARQISTLSAQKPAQYEAMPAEQKRSRDPH